MGFRRIDLPDELTPEQRAAQLWFLENFQTRFVSALHWDNLEPWFKQRRRIMDNFFIFPAHPIFAAVDGEEKIIEPGEFWLVPEGRWHWYGLIDDMQRTAHVIVHTLYDSRFHINPMEAFPSVFHKLDHYDYWYARLRRLACLGCHSPVAVKREGEALMTELILDVIFSEADRMTIPEPHVDARIAEVVEYVNQHLDSVLTVEGMAVRCELSVVRFRQLFKRHTGMSPRKYLVNARIRRAAELLLDRHLRIADIAAMTGFSNEYYFSTAFKRTTGLSPSLFREREWGENRT